MSDGANKTGAIVAAVIGAVGVIVAAIITSYCTSSPKPPGQAANTPVPVETATPSSQISFVVIVRDGNNNSIGQATVVLAVGNETIAQSISDDNGQAKFSVDGRYSGKSARLYAKAKEYHPADLEVSLTGERQIIQLFSNEKHPPE